MNYVPSLQMPYELQTVVSQYGLNGFEWFGSLKMVNNEPNFEITTNAYNPCS